MTGFPVRTAARAKANLFLKVLGLLPEGKHELLSLTVPLDLADDVEILDSGPLPGPDLLKVTDAMGPGAAPTDPSLTGPGCLVLKSVSAFRAATGFPGRRVEVRIVKRVPYAAGLGGSSSDAAAVMAALNSLAPKPLAPKALADLALPLGADIPFFLGGPGPKIVRGVGEKLEPYMGPGLPPAALLASPGKGLSTGEVFREYELTKTGPENILSPSPSPSDPLLLPPFGANDLLFAAARLSPELALLGERVARAAPGPFGLSGSGPTFWALFDALDSARGAAGDLAAEGLWTCACLLDLG
ncbi:MAG: hypothetical protein LBQ12_01555 [Deltaproteobacteria bacterium]|jgi:4-diphosphocytidyl-2-C-methyl-D-erythritol kinase|nr:hypothetical protein [Deltaproteobacteria bacterium]